MSQPFHSPIVSFDARLDLATGDPRRLLGGKGANLIEMRQELGLRVPPGFVITTDACRAALTNDWSAANDPAVGAAVAEVEEATGRRFGGATSPLLVSVRSGAPVSMPGMLDTLLNVGMNEEVAEALATESGDRDFAEATWLRFVRMYAEIVLGVGPETVAAAVDGRSGRAAIDAVRVAAESWGGIPDDPVAQLSAAIDAVFRSWNGERAVAFRAKEGIDDEMGTACVVQAMVFGNLNDQSGTGVLFTRDPSTGERELYGDYLAHAQGEDVVSGAAATEPIAALGDRHPEAYAELAAAAELLERHYRDMCDIEFTVVDGTLYLLQTRVGRRSPQAAVVIAVDMAQDPDFPLSPDEAVQRVDPSIVAALRSGRSVRSGAEPIATGLGASPGVGVGRIETDIDRAVARADAGEAVVLVRDETSPADVRAMMESVAIITRVGGVGSHAAVVARGWGIPAVVGSADVEIVGGFDDPAGQVKLGTTVVQLGELVTVDGSAGAIYLGDQSSDGGPASDAVEVVERWRHEASASSSPDPLSVETASGYETASAVDEHATALSVVRVVQFKGLATPSVIAEVLGVGVDTVEQVIAALPPGSLKSTSVGVALTPEGRDWLAEQLVGELDDDTIAALAPPYRTFVGLNTRFKQAITEWQTSQQDASAFAALTAELVDIDGAVQPIVATTSAQAPRLGNIAARFDAALRAIQGGDRQMIASPMVDSYHTVWFEFHEEFIHLSGHNRAEEEAREAQEVRNQERGET